MEFAAEREGNQAGITRITYLGGLLLPFTAVATVLSMSDPFNPGNHLFWVFWVASIPLTVFTVLLIYADELRRLEVWVEVSADNLQEIGGRDVRLRDHGDGDYSYDYDYGGDEVDDVDDGRRRRSEKVPDDGYDHRMSIRVGTASKGHPSLSYRELAETDTKTTKTESTPTSAESAPAALPAKDSDSVTVDDDVREIVLEVVGARRRRRFRITNPLGGPHAEVYTRTTSRSSEHERPARDAAVEEDIVVINMYTRSRSRSRSRRRSPDRLAGERPMDRRRPAIARPRPVPGPQGYVVHGYELPHIPRPSYVMQAAAAGGAHARAWRRQQLGWIGAAGSLMGFRRPHRMQEMPPGSAAEEKAEGKARMWKMF